MAGITYQHKLRYKGKEYVGEMTEYADVCEELVYEDGNFLYRQEFPRSNLGAASRDEYVRVMTASIAEQKGK